MAGKWCANVHFSLAPPPFLQVGHLQLQPRWFTARLFIESRVKIIWQGHLACNVVLIHILDVAVLESI